MTQTFQQLPNQQIQQTIIKYLHDPKINQYTPQYLISILNKKSLIKIQSFMNLLPTFNITSFFRYFRSLLPSPVTQDQQHQFFILYALFKLFQNICNHANKVQLTFSDISTYLAQKMPDFSSQSIIQQKLLPIGLQLNQQYKSQLIPPKILGQLIQDRCYFIQKPFKSDKIQHLGRDVGQSQYSKKFKLFFTIDRPSTQISILDQNFTCIQTLQTQHEMSKRNMIINYIQWSDRQQKICCILGNNSISIWSKSDNYKYQINVPLPQQYSSHPFIIIKYMDSIQKWIVLDNRPVIHVLNHNNYQPLYTLHHLKIKKTKQFDKILLIQLHYSQLLCLGYQKSVYLISITNKQIVSEIRNFKTLVTSITFSQHFQALFVSTYQTYFKSYELSQCQDLKQRGKFQGHKSIINLLGTIQKKPIVFSIQENSTLKMFDIRDYTCYQSFSVLKNIMYKQILYLQDYICLVGSKMHLYKINTQLSSLQQQQIIYITSLHKDILIATTRCLRLYSIRNGSLKSVIKTIFDQSQSTSNLIYSIFPMPHNNKLMIQNQQGKSIVLQTRYLSQKYRWNLQPKSLFMFYDQQHQLLTQTSIGNIYISLYKNDNCSKQLKKYLINRNDSIRLFKISVQHDLIIISYQKNTNLYFFSYERAKMLGYLYFGQQPSQTPQNSYQQNKIIYRIYAYDLLPNKNVIIIVLNDQLLLLTFHKSSTTISFTLKKSIKLWCTPILPKNQKCLQYNQPQPLHSSGLSILQKKIIIISNQINIICLVDMDEKFLQKLDPCTPKPRNYNPFRTAHQDISKSQFTTHLPIANNCTNISFITDYYQYNNKKYKLGQFVHCNKMANILAIADNKLNIIFIQNQQWNHLAGIINCHLLLPKLWNVFMYDHQQIKQMQFVLDFMDNQKKMPHIPSPKALKNQPHKNTPSTILPKITMQQLLKTNPKKPTSIKFLRSCSLKQKKLKLQRQKQQKLTLQNLATIQYQQQKKIQFNTFYRNNMQKRINDTLAYLSLQHHQGFVSKGLTIQQNPLIKALQQKLFPQLPKQQKPQQPQQQQQYTSTLLKTKQKLLNIKIKYHENKILTMKSTQIYKNLTDKLGIKRYSSKQLLNVLNHQKSQSQLKSLPKNFRLSH